MIGSRDRHFAVTRCHLAFCIPRHQSQEIFPGIRIEDRLKRNSRWYLQTESLVLDLHIDVLFNAVDQAAVLIENAGNNTQEVDIAAIHLSVAQPSDVHSRHSGEFALAQLRFQFDWNVLHFVTRQQRIADLSPDLPSRVRFSGCKIPAPDLQLI